MKILKKCISFFAAVLVLGSFMPHAFAEDTEEGEFYGSDVTIDYALDQQKKELAENAGKTLSEIAKEHNAVLWHYNPYGEEEPPEPALSVSAAQSWDDVVKSLFEKYGVYAETENEHTGNVSLAYFNTVTGEEHYFNGDRYLVSASLFKIPENMIVCDKIYNGEINFDTQIYNGSYRYYQYRTLVHSDNDCAWNMFNWLGGYASFKQQQIHYLGSDPTKDLGWNYNVDNYYTARQITNCLKMVYNEPERFKGIIQNLLQANPYEYFKMFQREYPVAQKYGFVSQTETTGSHTYINCGGILYTPQPVILVVFTDNLSKAYDVIGEYSTLMADYTAFRAEEYEKQLAVRAESDRKAAEEASAEVKDEISSSAEEMSAAVKSAMMPANKTDSDSSVSGKRSDMSVVQLIAIIGILTAMVFGFVVIFRRNSAGKINAFFGVLAIIVAAAALLTCVFAVHFGTVFAKPDGNPQDTVNTFFTSIQSGDYSTAYSCLGDYASLGLENDPSGEDGKMIWSALKKSYGYTLIGDCSIDKLSAVQKVSFRYLSLSAIENDAAGSVEHILNELVQQRTRGEVYDDSGHYLPAVTNEVYNTALTQALRNAEEYYTSAELDVKLEYTGGRWYMLTSPELISAIVGGAE